MNQVPALFLPKGTYGKKTSVKASPVFFEKKIKQIKIAALLKGDNSGHEKNTSKNNRKRRRTPN